MAGVHDLARWVRDNGEPKALERLQVSLAPDLQAEGIRLASTAPDTVCTPTLLSKLSDQATAIVGKACPY